MARAGNTRFTHNQDVARARARAAKTGSAHLKVAGGPRVQYPVRP